jgi:hypothetical protein
MASIILFLFPFNLHSYLKGDWSSPLVVSFWVLSPIVWIDFGLYEGFVARRTFMPWRLIKNPTFVGACMISAIFLVSFCLWNAFFTSFLQAVMDLSLQNTTYVANIYIIGSCVFSVVVGALIRGMSSSASSIDLN